MDTHQILSNEGLCQATPLSSKLTNLTKLKIVEKYNSNLVIERLDNSNQETWTQVNLSHVIDFTRI